MKRRRNSYESLAIIKPFLNLYVNPDDSIPQSAACAIAEVPEAEINAIAETIRNLTPEELLELAQKPVREDEYFWEEQPEQLSGLTQKPELCPGQCANELKMFWAQCRIFAFLTSDDVLHKDKLRLLEDYGRDKLIISQLNPDFPRYLVAVEDAIKNRQPIPDDIKNLFPDICIDFEEIDSLCWKYALPGSSPSEFLQECNSVTEYLVEEFIPKGSFVVIYGTPKVGKTHFAADLAFSIATGKSFLGRQTQRCRVGYVQKEESNELFGQKLTKWCEANNISPRELDKNLRIIGLSDRFPQLITSSNSKNVNKDSLREWERIARHFDVIVLDTLLSTTGANENDTGMMEKVCEALNELKTYGCTIIAIFHSKKSNPKEYRGVANTKQLADIMYCISRDNEEDPENTKLHLHTNGTRYGEPISLWFSIDYDSCRVKPEKSPEEEEVEKQLREIEELIATGKYNSEKELINAITKNLNIGRKKAKELLNRGIGTRWKVKEIPGRGNPRRVYKLITNEHPGSSRNALSRDSKKTTFGSFHASIANGHPGNNHNTLDYTDTANGHTLYIRCDEKGERYKLSLESQSIKRTPHKVTVGERYLGCSFNSLEPQSIKRSPSLNGHLESKTFTYQGERLIPHGSKDTANVHLGNTHPPLSGEVSSPGYSESSLTSTADMTSNPTESDNKSQTPAPDYISLTSPAKQTAIIEAENSQQATLPCDSLRVKSTIAILPQKPDTSRYEPIEGEHIKEFVVGQQRLVKHNGEEKIFKIIEVYFFENTTKKDVEIYWLGKRIDKPVEEYLWGKGGDIQKYTTKVYRKVG